ncbi:unnamed protein product [Sphagnum troendelagicum]|uniref:[Histone H3]-lysine(27) N-trimethyltransferase n=1 Tax=Sphagnum troendelagicum TaxID=128251 RepID=A0ABP0TGS9_9BRYO
MAMTSSSTHFAIAAPLLSSLPAEAAPSITQEGVHVRDLENMHAKVAGTLEKLKKQVQADRQMYIKMRVESNREQLKKYTEELAKLNNSPKQLSKGQELEGLESLCLHNEQVLGNLSNTDESGDKDGKSGPDESNLDKLMPIIFGSCLPGAKTAVRPLKLPKVENVPPYTTWIYLDRNQRMTEDQSVVGRRRIYYDSDGNETLIASDSEEEDAGEEDDKEEAKHEFTKGEDSIIWMAVQELGFSPMLLEELAALVGTKHEDIEARYDILLREAEKKVDTRLQEIKVPETCNVVKSLSPEDKQTQPKDLLAAMDSFDNLFCRRCLVFDCRLHGCSQAIVHPSERQQPWSNIEDGIPLPCSKHCCLLILPSDSGRNFVQTDALAGLKVNKRKQDLLKSSQKQQDLSSSQNEDGDDLDTEHKRSRTTSGGEIAPSSYRQGVLDSTSKETVESSQKTTQDRGDRPVDVGSDKLSSKWLCLTRDKHTEGSDKVEGGFPLEADSKELILSKKNNVPAPLSMDSEEETRTNVSARGKGKVEVANNWTMLEMGLYEKGLQIFGKNSCLIAKNLLKGFKSCAEVAQYTLEQEASGDGPDGVRRCTDSLDIDAQNRARMYGGRRKGRVRKLKYTWKSVVHPLIRKRMANGKDQPCRQYTPCSCLFTCGKQCPCLLNGTCCEKYCGCSKSCKNRFRGCHCAKSQCCSRQCPCFAAGRECDPDVCRNCWVGCGDGTLGGPAVRGDSYDCRNMKVMLKQQQRVLLGRSDVAGWGAFLKNPVGKHEYLGEYTGELISHREADKRGKIYDRENSSFLFNLNDQYVLDACRKGDKLKFANHSPNPNCHAKVIMVSGDHRVGIFAKERILAGDEIFYDYRYEADRAPIWAKKQDDPNQKVQDLPTTSGRARKLPEGKPF